MLSRRNEEAIDTEPVSLDKKESLGHALRRVITRELRILKAVFRSAFTDQIMLYKWMFSVRTVDRLIKENARYFEKHPDDPNGIAILACHGFAATPEIFNEISQILCEHGYYFRAIRLPGHGTSPSHLAQTSGEDWFASVLWHYDQIKFKYDRIFFLGHSLGGTLGLLLSTIYPIETIIALSSPVNLHIKSARFVRQVSAFVKYWPRSRKKKRSIQDAGIQTYLKSPLYAIAGIFEVGRVLRERSDKLKLPVLYIKAGLDHKNLLDQPDEFVKYFPETPCEFREAKSSPHSSLLGQEKEMINQWIVNWFNEKRGHS